MDGVNLQGDVAEVPLVQSDPGEIKRAVAHHGAVKLKGGASGAKAFVELIRRLGPLMFTAGETPVAGFEDLNVVSNVGRTTPPKSVFHSDTSYIKQPPSYGALLGMRVPESGGATLFTDQYAAADALPEEANSISA